MNARPRHPLPCCEKCGQDLLVDCPGIDQLGPLCEACILALDGLQIGAICRKKHRRAASRSFGAESADIQYHGERWNDGEW